MRRAAGAVAVVLIVVAIALPVLYVAGEGAFYLATGASHFPPGSGYRTLYAPLDRAGDRWPAVYDARQSLANAWLRLSGDSSRRARVRPDPWPGFTLDVF